MQRPNFDTIRAGVNKGVSTATAMGYVKSCEDYITHLETQLGVPAGVTAVVADPVAKDGAPAFVSREAFCELATRVEQLEKQAKFDQTELHRLADDGGPACKTSAA